MTTFKAFLYEANEIPISDFEEFVKLIKSDCSEFLLKNKNQIKSGEFLYRGLRKEDDMFSSIPRSDRKPLSTNINLHNAFDDFFNNEFNFKYRSSSLFCVTDVETAIEYGSIFTIFPVDGYKLCYSDLVPDLYSLWDEIPTILQRADRTTARYIDSPDPFTEYIVNVARQKNKDLGRLNALLKTANYKESKSYANSNRNEVMVQCKKYYAIRDSFFSKQNMDIFNDNI